MDWMWPRRPELRDNIGSKVLFPEFPNPNVKFKSPFEFLFIGI